MSERVPDLLVEKLVLGELSEAEEKAVRERLGAEAEERIAAVKRSNEEILELHPPGEMAAAVQKKLEARGEEKKSSGGWIFAVPTLAAAAAVVFVVFADPGTDDSVIEVTTGISTPDDDGGEVIVLKGDARLSITRRRGTEDRKVRDGDSVQAGDVLQVSYDSGGAPQGVIVSLDGRGVVTLHHPKAEGSAPALSKGGSTPLGHSYELDDAPGFERFFFVTGDDVDVAAVQAAVEKLGTSVGAAGGELDLPQDWSQVSVLLKKD
jgi:hypothetical protein